MNATHISLKSLNLRGFLLAGCVLVATLLATSNVAQAVPLYADGSQINLVTGRSNTFTSSGNANGVITGPIRLAYPDLRFDAAGTINTAYWQVNFPTPYEVSEVYVITHEAPYRMMSMNVQTTTDGVNWVTQASPTADANAVLTTSFTPVSGVIGVRLLSTDSENAAYPAIFKQIRVTGPNDNLPLYLNGKTEFSVSNALWADASVQSAVGWGPYSGGPSQIVPIDDATTMPYHYNKTIYSTSAAIPAPIDILLNQNYMIDSVAITSGGETNPGGRTATHVNVSYSSDEIGGLFTEIVSNYVLIGSPSNDNHYVIDLGGLFDARRVRFEFSHPNSSHPETFISELYVFATEVPPPAPEPSSITLFALGLGALALKRRKSTRN